MFRPLLTNFSMGATVKRCVQEGNNGELPRGQILIEMIDFISQQPDMAVDTTPVEPRGKATVTWGDLKASQ